MKLRYVIEKEMLVKEYFDYVGLSHHLKKKVRALDNIVINGCKGKNYYPLKKGDVLELEFKEAMNDEYQANYQDKVDILYEDDYLLVINKPSNIASQPSHMHPIDNVLSILKAHFLDNTIDANIHLVNRLDFPTSGLMIVSKSGICQYELGKTKIIKKYLGEVKGTNISDGVIEKAIEREEKASIKRHISDSGKKAITRYHKIKERDGNSILDIELLTGRCHQIRVHLSSIGYPLIGDKLYDDSNKDIKEDLHLHLHAYYLSFYHPFNHKLLEFTNYPSWYN